MCICEINKEQVGFTTLNKDTASYSRIELAMWRDVLRARSFNDEGNLEFQEMLKIKYCPFCGEKIF